LQSQSIIGGGGCSLRNSKGSNKEKTRAHFSCLISVTLNSLNFGRVLYSFIEWPFPMCICLQSYQAVAAWAKRLYPISSTMGTLWNCIAGWMEPDNTILKSRNTILTYQWSIAQARCINQIIRWVSLQCNVSGTLALNTRANLFS
jgi:hypothetical protein